MRDLLRRMGLRIKLLVLACGLLLLAVAGQSWLLLGGLDPGQRSALLGRALLGVLGWAALGGLLGWLAGGRITRPLKQLLERLRQPERGFESGSPAEGELGLLQQRLGELFADLEAERKQVGRLTGELEQRASRADQNAARTTRQHEALLESVRDAILLLAPDGRVLDANRAALELFGHDLLRSQQPVWNRLEDPVGFERALSHGLARQRPVLHLARLAHGGTPLRVRLVPASAGAAPDEPLVMVAEDEGESLRLEEQMLRSERLAALGTLSAGLAHQLGNQLNAIRGYARLLERSLAADPARQGDALRITREVDTASELMDQVMLVGRTRPATRAPMHLPTILRELLDAVRPECERKRVEIVEQLASPGCVSSGDPGLFQQALLNIIVNALQAMPDGGRLRVGSHCRGDDHCLLSVADSGQGVPEGLRRQIFDPFFSTKPEGEGTGLGLAVTHRILELHGATVTVGEGPDGGAEFVVDLPLVDEKTGEVSDCCNSGVCADATDGAQT